MNFQCRSFIAQTPNVLQTQVTYYRAQIKALECQLSAAKDRQMELFRRLQSKDKALQQIKKLATQKFKSHSQTLSQQICRLRGQLTTATQIIHQSQRISEFEKAAKSGYKQNFINSLLSFLQKIFGEERLIGYQSARKLQSAWKLVKFLGRQYLQVKQILQCNKLISVKQLSLQLQKLKMNQRQMLQIINQARSLSQQSLDGRRRLEERMKNINLL